MWALPKMIVFILTFYRAGVRDGRLRTTRRPILQLHALLRVRSAVQIIIIIIDIFTVA